MAEKSVDKVLELIGSLTVMQAAELVKKMEEEFGISTAMPVAAAPAGNAPAAEAAVEKTEFKVEITDAGSEKIKAIKALRKVKKDLGLAEAKKVIESAPTVIGESVPKDEAEAMKKGLEEAGVKVKLS